MLVVMGLWVLRLYLALAAILLAGCVTPLQRPDGERAIANGKSTYDDVVKLYGRPQEETRNSEGKRLVSYYQARGKPSFSAVMIGRLAKDQGDVEMRRLDVLFSPDNFVQRYHFAQASQQVTSKFSHFETGANVTDEHLKRIAKGTTSHSELMEWFGPPITEGLNFDGQIVASWIYGKINAYRSRDWQTLNVILNESGHVIDYSVHQRKQ